MRWQWLERAAWWVALGCGIVPLWSSHLLPLVDLPQHLHLISALHRLDDASTLYPEALARRPELTPYLGYYYVVDLLHALWPLHTANRVFLSAYAAALPLSLAFLLRSLRRPSWPALLALPFAYGDSFAWGFINYCAALPLAIFSCGCFVRAIDEGPLSGPEYSAPQIPDHLARSGRLWRRRRSSKYGPILVAPTPPEAPSPSRSGHELAEQAEPAASHPPTGTPRAPGAWGQVRGRWRRLAARGQRRQVWAAVLALSLVLVLLFHVQVFAWLALALPWLLFTTPAPEGKHWRARVPALLGVIPAVALFVAWVGLRLGQPAEIAPGQPWRSWGPMLSPENLAWKSFTHNLQDLVRLSPAASGWSALEFPILAGTLRDGTDQHAVRWVVLVALAAVLTAWLTGRPLREGPVARFRMLGLGVWALVLFFALPFDIRGYMYYLNTRYAHLAAALLVAAVPPLKLPWRRVALGLCVVGAVLLMWPMRRGYLAFDRESAALRIIADAAAPKARVMGLIYNAGSWVVRHPVYLHAAATVATEAGGLTNFSFALTPHSPLMYRGTPPPTFPSEWRPAQMRWREHGRHYDHFVLRGRSPEQVFGGRLGASLRVVAEADGFYLVRRR